MTTGPNSEEGFTFSAREELEAADAMRNYNHDIAALFARAWIDAGRPVDVLDFGAGIGSVSESFEQQTGVRPVALEIDARQRERLRERGFSVLESLDAVEGRAFGLVISSNVLEHVEDDQAALVRLHGALRPGGVLALFVPAFPILYTAYDRKIGHFRRYTRETLLARVRAAGFVTVRSRYRDALGFVAGLVYRMLHGRSGRSPSLAQLRAYDRIWPLSRKLDALGLARAFGKNLEVVAVRPRE